VQANTTTTNANTGATANNAPTVGVTPTKPAETPGPVNASTSTTTATPGPVQANTTTTGTGAARTIATQSDPAYGSLEKLPTETLADKKNALEKFESRISGRQLDWDRFSPLEQAKYNEIQEGLARSRKILRDTLSDDIEWSTYSVNHYNDKEEWVRKSLDKIASELNITDEEAWLLFGSW
jgi:hypothetical protein